MRVVERRARVILTASVLLALAACAEADGNTRGGEPLYDGGSSEDADAHAPPTLCIAPSARGTGHGFEELYRDYFARAEGASCAGNGRCHGHDSQAGTIASGGFRCPPNDKTACHDSMVEKLVAAADKDAPERSFLYRTLRKTAGGGTMPKGSACAFDETDMQRIAAWIRAGTPND